MGSFNSFRSLRHEEHKLGGFVVDMKCNSLFSFGNAFITFGHALISANFHVFARALVHEGL
jgi:hypothetical protein